MPGAVSAVVNIEARGVARSTESPTMRAMQQRFERRDQGVHGLRGRSPANDDGRRATARANDLAWLRANGGGVTWARVWLSLWGRDAAARRGPEADALFEVGARWARGDGQRSGEWCAVWSELLAHAVKHGRGDDVSALALRAMWRLETEPDWPLWATAWTALDAHRARLADSVSERELTVLGVHWLMTHDSPAWAAMWESVLAHALRAAWGELTAAAVALGLTRLRCGVFHGWSAVWSRLSRLGEASLTGAQRDELARLDALAHRR